MNDSQWAMLFTLMRKATDIKGLSAVEKGALIVNKAKAFAEFTTLQEFFAEIQPYLEDE